ncbi:glutamate-5-semialdehyde dehydrogenase [Ructibacterium gallinarum]|uniref:Gamma-glutamyl phosphate reductase n=1 Tax=Ructibacterium gallinarum TaxID=2779355 RepID=A0A9D5R836_9FIRM|nr:glutamate-5-semialdehyde dehydrogenase [Ructibacterium gallinarum]MBE5039971.1 glutamate-5-semialdehyde dehydrogenase [Ructibacterium gallinarum]
MNAVEELNRKGRQAKEASYQLAALSTRVKNKALLAMAAALREQTSFLLQENARDLEQGKQNGMRQGLLDRLMLNQQRISGMAEGIEQIAALPDPIGEMISQVKRPNGLKIGKVRVPLGVIGIIYEARPNVTADAAGLCIKAGNAVILRGGKEAAFSNRAIVKVMQEAAYAAGLPEGSIHLVEDTSRESATALMRLNEYLDVIIPRGGAGLIRAVVENATVPAIETGTGNCHVYVDSSADLEMAKRIVINAKTQRPSVCNAEEKLLVHQAAAGAFLPMILPELAKRGVEIIGDQRVCSLYPDAIPASEDDWGQEYLDLKLAVKIVDSLEEAISHINRYNSRHSEAIVTRDYAASQKFLDEIDAAAVYVNASTRFTDGFEFGFGAEIGISTQKIHARGPMGLAELTTTKYIIFGNGQIRE